MLPESVSIHSMIYFKELSIALFKKKKKKKTGIHTMKADSIGNLIQLVFS